VISVGVSGHRHLSNLDEIARAIDDVLGKILAHFGDRSLQVISPLAEGADRLVAVRAIGSFSARLIVPLPLEKSDYMRDFLSEASKSEFSTLLASADRVIEPSLSKTRQDAYLDAGLYVLDHSDVLITVWDGAPARGTGGTADIVAEARRREMPIAWVQVLRGKTLAQTAPGKTLSVQTHYERFPTALENEVVD
jgi:hypothetical protein